MILRGVFLADAAVLSWLYRFGASEIFPEHWDDFVAGIPNEERSELITAFAARLVDRANEQTFELARAWSLWEASTISLLPDKEQQAACNEPAYAGALAQIQTHYFSNKCWLTEDQILRDADRLREIPIVIVHGRYDICCPVSQAFRLSKCLPHADLQIIECAGHVAFDPKIRSALLKATDTFALG